MFLEVLHELEVVMLVRRNIAIAILTLTCLVMVGLVLAQKSGNQQNNQTTSREEILKQDREDATPVQEGILTPQQKEHSKLYKQYKTGKSLRDLTISIGDVTLRRYVGAQGGDFNEPPFSLQNFLQRMADKSDAVVVATIRNKSSQLTEGGDYIFTDYEMAVDEVLQDDPAAPIKVYSNIIVTRPGGTVLLNGRVVKAIDESFQPFVKDGQYLLFLKAIPNTGSYQSLSSKGSFQIKDNKVLKVTKEAFGFGSANIEAFFDEVRTAITNSLNKRSVGGVK